MKQYIPEYIEYLRIKGLSEITIISRRRELMEFYRYMELKGINDIGKKDIEGYKYYLINEYYTEKGKKLNNKTVNNIFIVIREYFKYLTREKRYLFNPAEGLEYLKVKQGLFGKIPSHEEIESTIERIDTTEIFGKRNKSMIELLYSSALRTKELIMLDIYDIDIREKRILVRNGKGKKDRIVPMGKKACQYLKEYIKVERKYFSILKNSNALFISFTGDRLSRLSLKGIIRKYRTTPKISAHRLRHACALGMLRNGASIRYIQELLGHESLSATQNYTKVMPMDLQKIHRRFHPRG